MSSCRGGSLDLLLIRNVFDLSSANILLMYIAIVRVGIFCRGFTVIFNTVVTSLLKSQPRASKVVQAFGKRRGGP